LGYAQNGLSKGFSIEAGLGTSHAPRIISLNYDLLLNDNWKTNTIFNSYSDFPVIYNLPWPLINLKYQF
jgi:hypothetical protein